MSCCRHCSWQNTKQKNTDASLLYWSEGVAGGSHAAETEPEQAARSAETSHVPRRHAQIEFGIPEVAAAITKAVLRAEGSPWICRDTRPGGNVARLAIVAGLAVAMFAAESAAGGAGDIRRDFDHISAQIMHAVEALAARLASGLAEMDSRGIVPRIRPEGLARGSRQEEVSACGPPTGHSASS